MKTISKNAWRSVSNVETVLGSVTASYKHTYKMTKNASTIIQTKIGEVNQNLIDEVAKEIGLRGEVGERLLKYEVIKKLDEARQQQTVEEKRRIFEEALDLMEKNYENINNFLNTTQKKLQDLKELIDKSSQLLQQTINRIIIYSRPVDYSPAYEIIGDKVRLHFEQPEINLKITKKYKYKLTTLIEKLNEYVKTQIQPDLEEITQENDLQKTKEKIQIIIQNLETIFKEPQRKKRFEIEIDSDDVSKIENITLQKLIQSYVDIVYKDENSIKGLVTKIKENLEKNNLEEIKRNLELLKKRVTLQPNIGNVKRIKIDDYWLANWFDTMRRFINEYVHNEKFLDATPEKQLETFKIEKDLKEEIITLKPEKGKRKNVTVKLGENVFADFLTGSIHFAEQIHKKLQEINGQREKEEENIIKTLNEATEKTNSTLRQLNENAKILYEGAEFLEEEYTEIEKIKNIKNEINKLNDSNKLNNVIEENIKTESLLYYFFPIFILHLKKTLFIHKQSFWNNFNIDKEDSVTRQIFIIHEKLIEPLEEKNKARKESQEIAKGAWNRIQELHEKIKQFLTTQN